MDFSPPFRIFITKLAQVRMALIHALTLRDFEYEWYLVGKKDECGNIHIVDARLRRGFVHATAGSIISLSEIAPEDAKSHWYTGADSKEGAEIIAIYMHTHHWLTVHSSTADWDRASGTFGITTRFGEVRFYYKDDINRGGQVLYPVVPVTMEIEPSSLSLEELESMARELAYLTRKYSAYFGFEAQAVQVLTFG